ncbi:MAG: hypothetical protein JST54_06430 [Deltaproteobacteria bacterium]|nr:hypothetical protein [Deltaproteobacteria bacterium]
MRTSLALALSASLLGCSSEPTSTSVTSKGSGVPTFSHPTAFYDKTGTWNVMIADEPSLCSNLQFIEGPAPIDVPGAGSSSIPSIRLQLSTGKFMGNDLRSVGDDMDALLDPGGPLGAMGNDGSCQEPAPVDIEDAGPFTVRTSCRNMVQAMSGSANLIHVDNLDTKGAHASGTFDVTFPDGGELQGSFVASPCTQLDLAGCTAAEGSTLFPLLALAGALALRRKRP